MPEKIANTGAFMMHYVSKYRIRAAAARISIALLVLTCLPSLVSAQQWNPRPGWKDSYAVGGKCYCDSNGYDHGLDTKSADTPIGRQNVVDICETIERVLGEGPQQGRIPYNDIQCGNGPANDAADETGCPGRVDIGPDGCNQIGPRWDLATAYANTPQTPEPTGPSDRLGRNDWEISASSNNNDVSNITDGNSATRWTTGTRQSDDQWIIIDLGSVQSFDRIVLNANQSPNDYPRAYSVFISSNGNSWGQPIVTGFGQGAVTDIQLAAQQTSRFIRITQDGASDRFWWSIHELDVYRPQNSVQPTEPPSEKEVAEWISSILSMILVNK